MKHILIPCDFSSEAEEAFIFGISLARVTQAEITVLYIIEFPILTDPASGIPLQIDRNLYQKLEGHANEKFKEFCSKHAHDYPKTKLVVKEGPVAPTINQYAEQHHIDFVVMGTKGASGLKEFFVGSNTEKVVRFSPVPVFSLRKAPALSAIKTIVHPTSLELDQTTFITRLKAIQSIFNAHLHLLYINTRHTFMKEVDIDEFISFYGLKNVSYSLRDAAVEQEGIFDFVKEKQPDLLAMATHGRRGLSHFFSGSISEDVINRIECPVWTCALKKTEDVELQQREQHATTERQKRHLREYRVRF